MTLALSAKDVGAQHRGRADSSPGEGTLMSRIAARVTTSMSPKVFSLGAGMVSQLHSSHVAPAPPCASTMSPACPPRGEGSTLGFPAASGDFCHRAASRAHDNLQVVHVQPV